MNKLIETRDLTKLFPVRRGIWEIISRKPQKYVHAVENVNLTINSGEIFALVGESGSGKTTLGKLLIRLLEPTSGGVYFEGKNLNEIKDSEELKQFRRKAQMIFQDPYGSLNPRSKIGSSLKYVLDLHNLYNENERRKKVYEILERVGLYPAEKFYDRYPHELSGGQRQRVAIARALLLKPKFIVADEPVAMVDVSIRAQILELMLELKKEMDLTYMIITHDLSLAHYIAENMAIMYLAKIVEMGSKDSIFKKPLHPYTQALMSSIPDIKARKKERIIIQGEVPNAIDPPKGCRFHPRCPFAFDKCKIIEPELKKVNDRLVACHLY
jgi:peptide/nickel transport system ATP-binding protein